MEMKVRSVKTKKNAILKEFIIEKYGSISRFTEKEKVPRSDVDVILHKADIFTEMNIGIKVCNALNIDAEELFCKGNIMSKTDGSLYNINGGAYGDMPETTLELEEIVKAKCLKLGPSEQKTILEYINKILET